MRLQQILMVLLVTLSITLLGQTGTQKTTELKKKNTVVQKYGKLQVISVPAKAEIALYQNEKIVVAWTGNKVIEKLPIGEYEIIIQCAGYISITKNLKIVANKTIMEEIILEPKTGKLQVISAPAKAEITLSQNGEIVESWTGNRVIEKLNVGEYEITAKLGDNDKIIKKVIIEKDKITTEKFEEFYKGFVFVEGGTFMMGSNDGESDEKPVHSVMVNSFYIGKYEVTQKEWLDVMGNIPSNWNGDILPVEKVSWHDAEDFITKLNEKTGKKYRLPTEAEWEYAARGGNKSKGYKYAGSNNIDEVAWYTDNSRNKTHPVGTKQPNELGIYDMSGNVWEWCSDWYASGYYSISPDSIPQGLNSGDARVNRGGSWIDYATNCPSSNRMKTGPHYRGSNVGFRLVQD